MQESPATSPRTVAETPAIDRDAFEELTLGDPALQANLLAAFLRSLAIARAGLRGVDDLPAFLEQTHRLKSSGHFVAAARMLRVVEELEQSPPAGREALAAAVARLEGELDLLEPVVRAFTGTKGSTR